jgi:hypothetical protein
MPEQEFGSDGQLHDTDRPLAPLAAAEDKIPEHVDSFEASEPAAAQRLREFEDEHLGADAVRIRGQVERGHGSLFQRLSPEHQKAYAAIEKTAEAEHNAALAAADDASRLGSG